MQPPQDLTDVKTIDPPRNLKSDVSEETMELRQQPWKALWSQLNTSEQGDPERVMHIADGDGVDPQKPHLAA
jgi:hypothetical protein